MSWLIFLVVAVLAYFVVKGLHARHLARCRNDVRTAEHIPDAIANNTGDPDFHNNTARALQDQNEPLPAPHDSPSLLYADRNNGSDSSNDSSNDSDNVNGTAHPHADKVVTDQSTDQSTDHTAAETTTQATSQHNKIASNENVVSANASDNSVDSHDFTAETATLRSEEVGTPANSSDYTQDDNHLHHNHSAHTASSNHAYNDAQDTASNSANDVANSTSENTDNRSANHAGIAAAGIAGVAGAASAVAYAANSAQEASEQQAHTYAAPISSEQVGNHQTNQFANTDSSVASNNQDIDLELGDSTSTDDLIDDEHDELLDFGDLTSDISEMLKELNLRETDSPRLEINSDEFAQLKTGQPGEVKPEKIENVAGKLRNMLQ